MSRRLQSEDAKIPLPAAREQKGNDRMTRHVRFVFATGYGEEAVDQAYRAYPRVQKPFDEHALVNVLLSARSS